MTADHAVAFDAKRVDLAYKASFPLPQFGLGNGPRSLHLLFARLRPFNVSFSELKLEGNFANPAGIAFSCFFPPNNAVLRLRLDALEVTATSPPVDNLAEIVDAAISATKEILGDQYPGIAGQELTWAAHGQVNTTPSEYFDRFVRKTPAGLSSAGIAFSIGSDSSTERLFANVVVAPSVLVVNALFFQVTASFSARRTARENRVELQRLIRESAEKLELALPTPEQPNA
jgi:hypothetical protein